MSTEALTPEILRGGEVERRRFDPKSALPFVNKSVSEETRRAYRRAVSEFFQFAGMKHPAEVVLADVVLWRDRLRSQRKSAATVAFKLSVVRSFFEYLKAAGAVPLNPASTKLVSPPELSSEPAEEDGVVGFLYLPREENWRSADTPLRLRDGQTITAAVMNVRDGIVMFRGVQ